MNKKRPGIYIYIYFKSERIKFKGSSARGLELYCRALYLMFLRNDEFLRPNFVDLLLSKEDQRGARNESVSENRGFACPADDLHTPT